MVGLSLLKHFPALENPPEVEGGLSAAGGFAAGVVRDDAGQIFSAEVVRWGRSKLAFLCRFLAYERSVPSHDTLSDVIAALDPELFKTAFAAWVEGLRGRPPLHMISAWASRKRLVLGQEATPETSSEIEAIALLLERLALTGAPVTVDAMRYAAAATRDIDRKLSSVGLTRVDHK